MAEVARGWRLTLEKRHQASENARIMAYSAVASENLGVIGIVGEKWRSPSSQYHMKQRRQSKQ